MCYFIAQCTNGGQFESEGLYVSEGGVVAFHHSETPGTHRYHPRETTYNTEMVGTSREESGK